MLKRMKSFLENTTGSILPTTAILIVPLMMASGVAVDYSRYVNMRNEVQTSLDAAGLATSNFLRSKEFDIPDNIKSQSAILAYREQVANEYAINFFEANVTPNVTKENYTLNVAIGRNAENEETVSITSTIKYDSIFGQTHREGSSNFYTDILKDDLESIVTLGNRTIEVALVMDNSGSMGQFSGGKSRLNNMKTAATELVSDLYESASASVLENPVQFSLVPFAGAVNIGKLGHDNHAGDYIDTNGFSPVNNENLDWDDTYRTSGNLRVFNNHVVRHDGNAMSRLDVFDMLGTEWAGCVEMRPYPHNVQDTVARNASNFRQVSGDGPEALFVPYFAPDEPDNIFNYRNGWRYYDDDRYRNSYLNDFYDADGTRLETDASSTDPAFGARGSARQIERTNWLFKYQAVANGHVSPTGTFGDYFGPNYGCTTKPITALTPDRSSIESGIAEMTANGSTNIQQGLTWGWRTLSEGLPFDQGRSKDDNVNLKFIILLTDGNNFYQTDGDSTPNQSAYGAWGYTRDRNHPLKHAVNESVSYHNRMVDGLSASDLSGTIYAGRSFDLTPESNSDFELIMNAHTAQACENIKKDGISIYTIAYDLSGSSQSNPTKQLMEACSGTGVKEGRDVISGVQFYHDADGANLQDTFDEIASSISAMRISR